jgi:hypothetical protein
MAVGIVTSSSFDLDANTSWWHLNNEGRGAVFPELASMEKKYGREVPGRRYKIAALGLRLMIATISWCAD